VGNEALVKYLPHKSVHKPLLRLARRFSGLEPVPAHGPPTTKSQERIHSK